MPDTSRKLYSVPEFGAALGITTSGIRRWVLERKVSYIKIGRLIRIPATEVDRLIAEGFRPAKIRGNRQ